LPGQRVEVVAQLGYVFVGIDPADECIKLKFLRIPRELCVQIQRDSL
jgi:hypothetical protein